MSTPLTPQSFEDHRTKQRLSSIIALSVMSIISKLEDHSRSLSTHVPKDKTLTTRSTSSTGSECFELSSYTRTQPQTPLSSFPAGCMESIMQSDENLDKLSGQQSSIKKAIARPRLTVFPSMKRQSSLHSESPSAFKPSRLSDWEPPVEWLYIEGTPDNMSARSESPASASDVGQLAHDKDQSPPPELVIHPYTKIGTAQPLLPESPPSSKSSERRHQTESSFAIEQHAMPNMSLIDHGLPTPPQSPPHRNYQSFSRPRHLSESIRKDISSDLPYLCTDATPVSKNIDTNSSLPGPGSPHPRLRPGPRREVSSSYSTTSEEVITKPGTLEHEVWQDPLPYMPRNAFPSTNTYTALLDDYRRLAQPRISVFDDHDSIEEHETSRKDPKLTPRPLFWNRAKTKRPTSAISEVSDTICKSSRITRRRSLERSFAPKLASTAFTQRNKTSISLTAQRAKGTLVISSPLPLNEAAYIAAVSNQPSLPASNIDSENMISLTDNDGPKQPWHRRLSPKNLASSFETMRSSMQKVTSPNRWSSQERKSSRNSQASFTPDTEDGDSSDAESWLSTHSIDDSYPGLLGAQNQNLKLMIDKMKWKSQAKERKKRNEALRNAIQHVSVEQARKVESMLGESPVRQSRGARR